MSIKLIFAIVAAALMAIYLIPVVFKLKEFGLGAVILIGLGMMLVDQWQNLQSKDN